MIVQQKSLGTGKSVRIIRSSKTVSNSTPAEGYRYDSLYTVTRAWKEKNSDDLDDICRYELKRVPRSPTFTPSFTLDFGLLRKRARAWRPRVPRLSHSAVKYILYPSFFASRFMWNVCLLILLCSTCLRNTSLKLYMYYLHAFAVTLLSISCYEPGAVAGEDLAW
ncbi:hypothetical protein DFH29DRAFT_263558 [Suillus ampliporus]|nr:hypothetical protein DFH29DRAFT_263558 [Suillus ampliporus]